MEHIIQLIYLVLFYLLHLYIKKFLIIILLFLYAFISLTNCRKFYDGFGGEKLINDKETNDCKIKKPLFCGLDLLSGLFDVNYFRKNGCDNYNDDKKTFMKYLNQNFSKYNYFSYPRTEHWNAKSSFYDLANKIEKNIYPLTKNNSRNEEVFVSFKNGKGKIRIKLKKNESLIKEKRNIAQKFSVKFENVYIIYIDGISRINFMRKLKKSSRIIEKIIYREKKKKNLKFIMLFNSLNIIILMIILQVIFFHFFMEIKKNQIKEYL